MQVLSKLTTFIKNLVNPSDIRGRSIRLTIDTDGQIFICRLPELSLSATESTIGEAYENLRRQIRDADFAFVGTTDKEILSEISSIQATEVFNKGVRKKSVVFLGISILFVCLTIAVMPIFETKKFFASNFALQYIPKIADRIEDIEPKNKESLKDDISIIRDFLTDILSDEKNTEN